MTLATQRKDEPAEKWTKEVNVAFKGPAPAPLEAGQARLAKATKTVEAKELVALLSPNVIYHAVLDLSESIVDLEDDG